MKFSHSLQFNAVPEWSDKYINYDSLKKLMYSLERKYVAAAVHSHDEETSLLSTVAQSDETFTKALNKELDKICSFYDEKEPEIFQRLDELAADEDEFQKDLSSGRRRANLDTEALPDRQLGNDDLAEELTRPRLRRNSVDSMGLVSKASGNREEVPERYLDEESSDEDEPLEHERSRGPKGRRPSTLHSKMTSSQNWEDFMERAFNDYYDTRVTLKKRAVETYVALSELDSYCYLNKVGFRKALKKYDKIINRNLQTNYMTHVVAQARPFAEVTVEKRAAKINDAIELYARIATHGSIPRAKSELKIHLREYVVWERNTVWREMIGIERRAQGANILGFNVNGTSSPGPQAVTEGMPSPEMKLIKTRFFTLSIPQWLISPAFLNLIIILAIFITLSSIKTFETWEQSRCFAIVIFSSLMWATETFPLFVTALAVPFLVVILRVVPALDGDGPMSAPDTSAFIFSSMWNSVIMLLLGGFTLAAALSKFHIAKLLATWVLSKAGTSPKAVLLANMLVALIASMFISNVAAPVLCLSIIQPILRNLPTQSSFPKAMVLGIAFASNVGGMASPIASPQNIIAMGYMHPTVTWGQWFFVSIPVCLLSLVLIWLMLVITLPAEREATIAPIRFHDGSFTAVHFFVIFVTIGTILLWCFNHQMEGWIGDMGTVSLIPIVLFFGSGVLSSQDFNNFMWTIVALAMGGIALGKAVAASGLLNSIALQVKDQVQDLSLYAIMVIFGLMILVVATFISHTVAGLIVLPLVAEIGAGLDDPHPRLLVMSAALLCSAAMALPTSGFPNVTAICTTDELGRRYLTVKLFIVRGLLSSVFVFTVLSTVGYGLMYLIGL